MIEAPPHMFAVVNEVPALYQAPIYRALSRKLGDDFIALFETPGYSRPTHEVQWGGVVHTEGLLDGYTYHILDEESRRTRLANLSTLASHLRRIRPKTLMIVKHRSPFGRLAAQIVRSQGGQVVLRSTPYDLGNRSLLSHLGREFFLRATYKHIDAFAAVGTLPRIHFEHFSGRPDSVVSSPYCTDEDVMSPWVDGKESLRASFREEHNVPEHAFVFLQCSRLHAVKRLPWTLRAFQAFRRERQAKLFIVGNGPQVDYLQDWLRDNPNSDVHWLSFQNRSGVAKCLAGADALLLPSSFEPWGVVVNEALAFHLPVVASDAVASAVDLIEEGVTGFTFPSHNEAAYRARLFDVAKLVEAGVTDVAFDRINQRFSVANACAGLLKVHES